MEPYDAQQIERKWQQAWAEARAFNADDPEPGDDSPRFYQLEMLPYPSGILHVGHVLNYTMGEKSGLTAPVVDIASATTTVCVTRSGAGTPCR